MLSMTIYRCFCVAMFVLRIFSSAYIYNYALKMSLCKIIIKYLVRYNLLLLCACMLHHNCSVPR